RDREAATAAGKREAARAEAEARAKREAELAREQSDSNRQRAEKDRLRAETLLYASQLAQVYRDWQDNKLDHAWQILHTCQRGFPNWEHAHLRRLLDGSFLTLRGHQGKINCVAYSPDGNWIASGSEDRTVRFWNGRTGEFRFVLNEFADPVNSLSFS